MALSTIIVTKTTLVLNSLKKSLRKRKNLGQYYLTEKNMVLKFT